MYPCSRPRTLFAGCASESRIDLTVRGFVRIYSRPIDQRVQCASTINNVDQIHFRHQARTTHLRSHTDTMTSYATDDKDKIYTEHSENAISSDLEYRGGQTGNEKQDAQYLADAIEATKEQKDQGFKSAFSQYGYVRAQIRRMLGQSLIKLTAYVLVI